MEPVEIKVKGYEMVQTICKDGELDYKPLMWDGKQVLIVLLEPYEEKQQE